MWVRQARTREIAVADPELAWTAEHDGYAVLSPATVHRRSVRLDPAGRAIEITDVIDGGRARHTHGIPPGAGRSGGTGGRQGGAELARADGPGCGTTGVAG